MRAVWVVGRVPCRDWRRGEWELVGVCTSHAQADAACTAPYDFIYPIRLNTLRRVGTGISEPAEYPRLVAHWARVAWYPVAPAVLAAGCPRVPVPPEGRR